MTQEQRNLIDEIILPKLVLMAIDGTLPSDMSQLSSHYFDEEVRVYNTSLCKEQ